MALAPAAPEISDLCARLGLGLSLQVLERAWERELGPLAAVARLSAINHRTVVVDVDSPTAFQEISLRRRELSRRLNAHFAAPWIEQLRVRLASQEHGR